MSDWIDGLEKWSKYMVEQMIRIDGDNRNLAERVAKLENRGTDEDMWEALALTIGRVDDLERSRKADDDADSAHTSPCAEVRTDPCEACAFHDGVECEYGGECAAWAKHMKSVPWYPFDRPAGWEKKPAEPVVFQVGDLITSRRGDGWVGRFVEHAVPLDLIRVEWLSNGVSGLIHEDEYRLYTPADGQIRGGRLVKVK